MLDRRREIHDALLRIRDFCWPTADGVYEVVVRFNRSFEVLQKQLRDQISESEFPSIHKLHKMIGSVGNERVPWAFYDAGRPKFWDTIIGLANEGMNEVLQFPEPSFTVDTSCFDPSVAFAGTKFPPNPSPEEHCIADDEELASIHFQRWWELRCAAVEVLRNYGYTSPEDTVGIDRFSFYLTEDELDDEQNVYIGVGPQFSLSVDVAVALSSVMRRYDDWIAVLGCSENCTICVGAERITLVGTALKNCKSLEDAISVARAATKS